MPREVVIFINGILTRPGDAFAWTDSAVRWFNRHLGEQLVADRFEYFSPALFRRLTLQRHAQNLARALADYAAGAPCDFRLHLVGHSNGCELIARALELNSSPIASVHLISAALDRDFGRNGLARRLERGQVGAVHCYCSKGDNVLRFGARPTQLFRALGLGYGDLGYRGPAGVPEVVGWKVHTHWAPGYGHSDWFTPPNFESTMLLLKSRITP